MKRDDEIATLRVPPHSLEAEQSLLGAMLMDPSALDCIGNACSESDFYDAGHRRIWSVAVSLLSAKKPSDVVSVLERLGKDAEEVGGLPYLHSLAMSVPSAANARRYAEIVRERAIQRRLIAACDEAANLAWQDGDTAAKLEHIAAVFGRLERIGQRTEPKRIESLLAAALMRYDDIAEGRRTLGMRTHFRQFDGMTGGLKPGKVYGIAARPSVGKSSTARSIAIRVAQDGSPVLVLSQEMPQDEQTDCVIAELGRVDSQKLQDGGFESHDWDRVCNAVDAARGLPLYFDEQGALTLHDIRTKARAVKGLRLLIVDYLQLCSSTLKDKTTNDQIAELSKGLKALSLEMQIPIIVLSQLNRDVEKRADKEPQLSDLRDSGAIEQDLDVAVLLWTVLEAETSRIVGFKVAKNRAGKKGRFAMRFEPAVYGWTDCEFPAATPAPRKGANL